MKYGDLDLNFLLKVLYSQNSDFRIKTKTSSKMEANLPELDASGLFSSSLSREGSLNEIDNHSK